MCLCMCGWWNVCLCVCVYACVCSIYSSTRTQRHKIMWKLFILSLYCAHTTNIGDCPMGTNLFGVTTPEQARTLVASFGATIMRPRVGMFLCVFVFMFICNVWLATVVAVGHFLISKCDRGCLYMSIIALRMKIYACLSGLTVAWNVREIFCSGQAKACIAASYVIQL